MAAGSVSNLGSTVVMHAQSISNINAVAASTTVRYYNGDKRYAVHSSGPNERPKIFDYGRLMEHLNTEAAVTAFLAQLSESPEAEA